MSEQVVGAGLAMTMNAPAVHVNGSKTMRVVWQMFRYVLTILAIAGLVISIKACSSPPDQASNSTTPATTDTAPVTQQSAPININTAILSELDKLEATLGVPALSHKIQSSRPYGSIDDLVNKKVLTADQFNQVKAQLTVEDVVLTGVAKDVDYMTKLSLMKGHMLVADELLTLKQPTQAEPHLGHPVEEIYVDLEAQLPERQVADFKQTLMDVQNLVKSKPNDPKIQSQFDAAMKAIDTAIAALPETQRMTPNFTLQVINGLLETATAEYTAAIANGKIAEAIEYQDSRGFVTYAQTLYQQIEPTLKQTNAAIATQIETTLADLQKAWPAAIPPAKPVISSDQVAAQVKQIEQSSKPVVNASAS